MRAPGEMEVLKVLEVRKESSRTSSLFFSPTDRRRWSRFLPGQFIMVWAPGVDEVPMSVSYLQKDPFMLGITVQDIGEATKALCSMKDGDLIGIRGPYGKGFRLPRSGKGRTFIVVSGGVGGASTILAMERARASGARSVALVGSRDRDLLLFAERWKAGSDRAVFATDDGSFGHKGFVTDLLASEIASMSDSLRSSTTVLTCGPEAMMVKVAEILSENGVKGQFSLERFMKCGMGICDSCAVSGRRVCMDGPVFSLTELRAMKEFGSTQRDRSGRLVPLKECVR